MRTLSSGKPIVKTIYFDKFWQGYFYLICTPAALWGFGVLLDDRDLSIGFWWLPAIGLSALLYYGSYIEATKQDPNEFRKPGEDPRGGEAQPSGYVPYKQTHAEWAWKNIWPFAGVCIWMWGLIAFSHFTD